MKQKTLDCIRILNKHFTNKLMIHLAGKKRTMFGELGHVGRKSGTQYRIPIITRKVDNGFVFAMTYGKKVDWYANVKASGGGTLFWKGKDYSLINPEYISPEITIPSFPTMLQGILRKMGIEYYHRLEVEP